MLGSCLYLVLRQLLQSVVLLGRSRRSKEPEILLLRHELAILRREKRGRASLTARRFRRTAARGGGTITHRVRAVLTDRRVLIATGGPEGKHKFVILMILDYTASPQPVPESGHAGYKQTFQLENGYPT